MRTARLKLKTDATYHVMSRTLEGRFSLGNDEKSFLSDLMRRMETFSGCTVRTYILMDNHFHILLHVPKAQLVDDDEVLHCKVRYFSDGGVIGSAAYVKEVLRDNKDLFCAQKRCVGPQPMKYSDWGDLCVAKKLRKRVLSIV